MSISSIPVPLCIFRGLCFPVKSKHLLWVKAELQRQKLVHCNAKKQGTRRQLACWSGFSSRNATAFYDHLRLSVVSVFFNPQSVNTNHRILPQMIRVEMKHPSGPAESTAGHLARPVPCLPWHENSRLARQAGYPAGAGQTNPSELCPSSVTGCTLCRPVSPPAATGGTAGSLFGARLHLHSPAAPGLLGPRGRPPDSP